jgi:hypothetical protein
VKCLVGCQFAYKDLGIFSFQNKYPEDGHINQFSEVIS